MDPGYCSYADSWAHLDHEDEKHEAGGWLEEYCVWCHRARKEAGWPELLRHYAPLTRESHEFATNQAARTRIMNDIFKRVYAPVLEDLWSFGPKVRKP